MSGSISRVIAPWGMRVFLVLTPMQREALRFHLDMARNTKHGTDRHALHVHVARSIAGLIEEDKPARTRKTKSASNHVPPVHFIRSVRRAA